MKLRVLDDIVTASVVMEMEQRGNVSQQLCINSSEHDINRCLNSNCSIGVFDNRDCLIAFSLCYYTEYGTAYIEKSFVDAKYRGRALQLRMRIEQLKLLRKKGVA